MSANQLARIKATLKEQIRIHNNLGETLRAAELLRRLTLLEMKS